jgi:N-acetylmuramoyl-L-alanine amidase
MPKMKTVALDPGHGMSNRRAGVYDPGACAFGKKEAEIAMDWANELRIVLQTRGHKVIRTRISSSDPAPVGERAGIAKEYGCEIMLSIHCNAANGQANGTETFYRGEGNKPMAEKINAALCKALGTKSRGVKTEGASQHARLAVMAFQPCFLIELGFIDNANDLAAMVDPVRRLAACEAIAELL